MTPTRKSLGTNLSISSAKRSFHVVMLNQEEMFKLKKTEFISQRREFLNCAKGTTDRRLKLRVLWEPGSTGLSWSHGRLKLQKLDISGSYVHLTFLDLTFLPFLFYFLTLSCIKTPRSRYADILQRGHHHCFIIKTNIILIFVRDRRFLCLDGFMSKRNLHFLVRL